MRNSAARSNWDFTNGFGLALAATLLVNALLLVLKESNAGLKNWMNAVSGHHWITHAIVLLVLCLVLGFVFSSAKIAYRISSKALPPVIAASIAIGSAVILGYYLIHAF